MRELHVPSPADVPPNPVRGVPLDSRYQAVEERIDGELVPYAEEVRELWRAAIATAPWTGPALWLRGDLHPANILVRDGRLAGVIDFGDMTGGDPATDLATAWLTFDAEGRAAFIAALDYDDDTWARARGWAVSLSTAMIVGSAPASLMHRVGVGGIEQALLDR
ncbi:aminoglycoside phosphotransferase (APT) family kinase protein [Glaciihabitans sp. UYNi722]